MNLITFFGGTNFDTWAVLGFRVDIIDYLNWYYEDGHEWLYLKACTELSEINPIVNGKII